ncbi:hypothetical protein RR24_21790, partial [Acinetobacter baumannii]
DYLLTTNDQSLNIVLLTMLDSGRSFIQDDKLIKQNFLKFNSCIIIFFKLGPSILYMRFISFNFI